MRAMVLRNFQQPLSLEERPDPVPEFGQVRLRVLACAVCRTDLHLVDGELGNIALPIVPGHEIVGVVETLGPGTTGLRIGAQVGVGWVGQTCGACDYCVSNRENLCDSPIFTGCNRDGGFATHVVVDARYTYPLEGFSDAMRAAPLMCAGLIGWRCLRAAGSGARIGLYGFGAAAHILAQVIRWQQREFYAFSRPGDTAAQDMARTLGATWAGGSDEQPPVLLDAAIIFAPIGDLVPAALEAVRKGGRVVCGGIHMSDIPGFPYRLLWGERRLVSVANLTRQDGHEFIDVARQACIAPNIVRYDLADANQALSDLRNGSIQGAAVLVPG